MDEGVDFRGFFGLGERFAGVREFCVELDSLAAELARPRTLERLAVGFDVDAEFHAAVGNPHAFVHLAISRLRVRVFALAAVRGKSVAVAQATT